MTAAGLLLIFTTSLLGSFHCAAMCGGFVVGLVKPGQAGPSALRLSVYHAGKFFTYVFIGGVAGAAGAALLGSPVLRAAQFAFAALAGALIVVVGLQTLGLLPGQNLVNRIASRLWLGPFLGPFFKTFRRRESLDGAFFLGLFNGFLPCGLVYTFALTAAGAGSPGSALLVMTAFGLGTIPMLLAVAWGGAALSGQRSLRPLFTRVSGALVILLGTLTALRGLPMFPALAAHNNHIAMADPVSPGANAPDSEMPVDLEPIPAPPFTLVNQDNEAASLQDYRGKVVALDFIYTSCTTTCPLLTATFKALQDGLGDALGRDVMLMSITVDPATDKPDVLKAFGKKWEADFGGWVFLTGDPVAIDSVAAQYAVYVERAGSEVRHTETILLIDGSGQLRAAFGLRADPQAILDKIHRLMRGP